jgi:hypothetical protein
MECATANGQKSTITVAALERPAEATVAENVGLSLQESKEISQRIQETLVVQRFRTRFRIYFQIACCPSCAIFR